MLLTDDDLMGESAYHDQLPKVIERLNAVGLLEVSEGADVVFPPGFTNREGQPLPLIVQKGHGGFNYATSDLACVIDRVERLGATLLVYVVGMPQSQHLDMVFTVAKPKSAPNWKPPTINSARKLRNASASRNALPSPSKPPPWAPLNGPWPISPASSRPNFPAKVNAARCPGSSIPTIAISWPKNFSNLSAEDRG